MQELLQQRSEIAQMFPDLHPPLEAQAAMLEANRCLNCFDAPCAGACPTHIDVPVFIKKIASGNLRGSALTILDANILGASCARVCPVEVLCEGACVMHGYDQPPIQIGRLQRFAMNYFHAQGERLPQRQIQERTEKIACIGAGPASLAAAAELRQRGFKVTVFDKRSLPGGLNTFGVAEYKLPLIESLREIELIGELGVEFRFDTAVGSDISLEQIEAEFDAVFLGIGLGASRSLGSDSGAIDALKFIAGYKTGEITPIRGKVSVIGAGNTAIDAAIAAKRLGADEVSILYRRTREQISAFDFEYKLALQEGIHFHWLTQPQSICCTDDGAIAVECVRTEIDSDGSLCTIEGSTFVIECSTVISAIGQSPMLEFLARCSNVQLEDGRVVIDRTTGQTTNPMYFAGGDCVNGGREVVDAVADGKRAAIAIAQMLEAAYV